MSDFKHGIIARLSLGGVAVAVAVGVLLLMTSQFCSCHKSICYVSFITSALDHSVYRACGLG